MHLSALTSWERQNPRIRLNNISHCHNEFPALDVPGVAVEGRKEGRDGGRERTAGRIEKPEPYSHWGKRHAP